MYSFRSPVALQHLVSGCSLSVRMPVRSVCFSINFDLALLKNKDRSITFIAEYKETALLYIYSTVQLITKHFTSYSDVDAAKGKG